jgi:ribosomal-protein-alanine acetyltransferase
MNIRAATLSDVPALCALEAQAVTAAHWSAEIYARVFEPEPARVALVIEKESAILGFIVALCAGPEWEIENVAVAPAARRHGLGTRLLSEFLDRARSGGAEAVFLEVRESNRAARALYEKWAFAATGRRRRYYSDPPEDAIVYRFELPVPGPASKETDVTIL